MKKVVIFGTSTFSIMMQYYLEKYGNAEVVAYTVDKEYCDSKEINGLPLISFEEIENFYSPKNYSILVALGYKNMNNLRKIKMYEVQKKGYSLQSFVHPSVELIDTSIGEGNIVLEHVIFSYHVQIGNGNIFWNGCNISHDSIIGDFNYFAPSSILAGFVNVKNNCFFGINSAVKDSKTINSFTLVGAGCYLDKNTNKYEVYVPNRSFKLEDKKSTDFM